MFSSLELLYFVKIFLNNAAILINFDLPKELNPSKTPIKNKI